MSLYQFNKYFNLYVAGGSTLQWNLYSDAGPTGKTWVVIVEIGLNGGSNRHYASFLFFIFDIGQGNLSLGEFGAATPDWIQQGTSFGGSMTASFSHGLNLVVNIGNTDSASQWFNVFATTWYY